MENDWLHELDSYADADASFDKDDLLDPIVQSLSSEDGTLYALPFYGESSFLMYREDVLKKEGDAERPTWDEVADIAAKVDGAEPGRRICLRGLPGWGEMFAPLTTVVNTFGGTWFTEDWQAQVNAPSSRRRPTSTSTWSGRTASRARPGGLHRVPQRDEPGQGGDVVRRHLRGRVARGPRGQQGRRQGRLRLRRSRRPRAGLAVGLGLGDAEDHAEGRRGRRVHAVGLEQGVRGARRQGARLGPGARGQAGEHLRDPGVQEGRRGLRRDDAEVDPGGEAHRPRCAAASHGRRPVRRDPGVPGPRHQGLPGHRRGHDRPGHGRRGPRQGQLAEEVASEYAN